MKGVHGRNARPTLARYHATSGVQGSFLLAGRLGVMTFNRLAEPPFQQVYNGCKCLHAA